MRAHVLMSPAHLLPRCQCQCHCDFMRPALSWYHPHLHQHLMLLPVQLTGDGAVVPLVRCVSIWCSSESLYVSVQAPARAPSACFFLLSPVLSVWVNASLLASSARFTPRLPLLEQHRHYWSACTSHWYRIRCLVASDIGMTLSVADGLPYVVSLRPSGHGWVSCLLPSGLAHVAGHLVLSSVQPIF